MPGTAGTGTVLGVVDDLALHADAGILQPGDALVLYTDGLIEDRRTDLDASITQLEHAVGAALATHPLGDLAGRLADQRRAAQDDRTVVVVWNAGVASPPAAQSGEVLSVPSRVLRLGRRRRSGAAR